MSLDSQKLVVLEIFSILHVVKAALVLCTSLNEGTYCCPLLGKRERVSLWAGGRKGQPEA